MNPVITVISIYTLRVTNVYCKHKNLEDTLKISMFIIS